MPKIIIYDNKNILVAELEGKVQTIGEFKTARFKNYRLMESQTIKKQIRKIEAAIKYNKNSKDINGSYEPSNKR